MKKILGPLLFLLSLNVIAGPNSAILMLRAIVPVTYKVEVQMTKDGPSARIHSNSKKHHTLPKYKITKSDNNYLVSVVHP